MTSSSTSSTTSSRRGGATNAGALRAGARLGGPAARLVGFAAAFRLASLGLADVAFGFAFTAAAFAGFAAFLATRFAAFIAFAGFLAGVDFLDFDFALTRPMARTMSPDRLVHKAVSTTVSSRSR